MTATWFHHSAPDSTLVFVHGVLSDNEAAWLYRDRRDSQRNCYWPELIRSDSGRFKDVSIYLAGYYTAIDSGQAGIRECADEVYKSLLFDYDGHPPAIEWPKITFVCHSLGGIVTRYMIERHCDSFAKTRVGLVLIASPSYGAGFANTLDWLLDQYSNKIGKELEWGSTLLDELDDRFRDVVHKKMRDNLFGIEFYEHHIPYHGCFPRLSKIFYPFLPNVIVSKLSAGRYFTAPVLIPQSDHITICKPHDRNARIHTELALFLNQNRLLPADRDLELINRQDTERNVEALRRLQEWLPANAAKARRGALGSLRDALSETRKYITERSAGQERSGAREKLLSQLWFKAAADLRPYDEELAFRCDVKGHGWADNSIWRSEEAKKLALSLNAMLDDLIGSELSMKPINSAPARIRGPTKRNACRRRSSSRNL